MYEGPNIARVAAVIGERGRAQVLGALMDGRALTATELADVAGELGVLIYDGLERHGSFVHANDGLTMTDAGWSLLDKLGMSAARIPQTRRPLCRACVDWSERRHHLAGALGAALAARVMELRWAKRVPHSRALHVTAQGEHSIREIFAR